MAFLSLLHFDGDDASTTMTDAVGVATWTAIGNAQLDTAQYKFTGPSSLLLDGTGDYVKSLDIGALPASGGWTIDFWVRFAALPAFSQLFDYPKVASGFGATLYHTSGTNKLNLSLSSNGTSYDIVADSAGTKSDFAIDTWYHIALVRDDSAGAYYLYVNGVVDKTVSSASQITSTIDRLDIGAQGLFSQNYVNGWIDEFSIRSGCAYPGGITFTPSTTPYNTLNFSMTGSGGGSGTGTATIANTKVITGSGGGSSSGTSSTAAIHFSSSAIVFPLATPPLDFQAEFGSPTSTSFDIVSDELVITGGTDVNVYDKAVLAGIDVSVAVDLIVRVTGVVTRMYWDNSFRWKANSKFKLRNQSTIVGHGGAGGAGGSASTLWNGVNGTDGGNGLELNGYTISIDNSAGKIYGGGGGGGGGAGASVIGVFRKLGYRDVWTDIWFGHFGWVNTAFSDDQPCAFSIAGGGGGGGYNGGAAGAAGTGFSADTNLATVGYSQTYTATDGDAGTLAPTESASRGDHYGIDTPTTFFGGEGGKNYFPGKAGANGMRAYSIWGVGQISPNEEQSQFGTPGVGGQPGKAINLSGGTINWISGRGFPNVIGEVS